MKYVLIFILLISFAGGTTSELRLDIMFTNDIHGGIDSYPATFMNPEFPPILGGGGSAATYIKEVRSMTDGIIRDNLLIDVGDFFQGHPIGTVSKGKAVIKYFNMMEYDLSVVGNHEYDLGEETLIEAYEDANFPILSCNIISRETGELVDYVKPFIIMEKLGIKIGIIGLTTTDTELMSFPDNIKNVDFLPAKECLEKYIAIVKDAGADIIMVVGHMGLPYEPEPAYQARYLGDSDMKERYWGYDAQELAHEVPGIDIFFGGHMHRGFAEPWEDPVTHTLVFQGWAYGSSIGHVTLKIDGESRTLAGYELPAIREGALITLFEDQFLPDPVIGDTILAMQMEAEKGMDDIIGKALNYISREGNDAQNLIGNLVCEAMLEATGADFAFMNLGGVRGELNRGPISYRDVFNVMPFDNQIVVMEVDGMFLKNIIETRVSGSRHGLRVAGVKITYSRDRDNYDRVTRLIIGSEPWKYDRIYKVVTTDFLLQGNAGLALLTKIPDDQITRYEKSLRDAIADYVRINSPVSASLDDRWVRDDDAGLSEELAKELARSRTDINR
ncbi:MAG: bifunctional metallophosphatase/5'-nucleotidase [Candidatus Cloacimonetes bacterium]|nr:bifunctional metallophosphatase/5'-nucleotidase [Candidatus Cloacimonadota bacterium]